jgi:hypothetical protein
MRRGAPALCAFRLAPNGPRAVDVSALIVDDGFFAVVLAAWWQLRRSAHLLPHLRKGPSTFHFSPGNRFVSWIMAAVSGQALLTLRTRRGAIRPVSLGNGRQAVLTHAESEQDTYWTVSSTMPIPVPSGRQATPRSGSIPDPMPQPVMEPPTFPFPLIKARPDGPPPVRPREPNGHPRPTDPATVPVTAPSAEPPTRRAFGTAVARRGSA